MTISPKVGARPQVHIKFQMAGGKLVDLGRFYSTFEFKAMLNGGYVIKAELFDSFFNLQDDLIKNGYFKESRTHPVIVEFQIAYGQESVVGETMTRKQYAILISLSAYGTGTDKANITFTAIDPPSWYLNMGDAYGGVFKGSVYQTLRRVIKRYAPGLKSIDVSRTSDSQHNKWWMMKMDPKTFLSSMLDWSSSVTQFKTQWLVASDGFNIAIKEQAQWKSRQRAYYRVYEGKDTSNVTNWDFLADNALSLVQTKLMAQGASAVTGAYHDQKTDPEQRKTVVRDSTTVGKTIAKVNEHQSFSKPPDSVDSDSPVVGSSSIASIPEIYSAGDLGLPYVNYLDGRPRAMYLNMAQSLLRVKLQVLGHAIWDDCMGLGVDTIFVRWVQAPDVDQQDNNWWMTGNWIVYGFHHFVNRGSWRTDLYLARYDHDAKGRKVGGPPKDN